MSPQFHEFYFDVSKRMECRPMSLIHPQNNSSPAALFLITLCLSHAYLLPSSGEYENILWDNIEYSCAKLFRVKILNVCSSGFLTTLKTYFWEQFKFSFVITNISERQTNFAQLLYLFNNLFFHSLSTEIADQCTEMSSSYPASVHRQSTIQMEQQEPSYNDRIVRENSRLPPDGREYPAQINSKFEKQHTTTTSSTTTKRFVKFIVIVSSSFSRCDRPTDGRGVASSLNK